MAETLKSYLLRNLQAFKTDVLDGAFAKKTEVPKVDTALSATSTNAIQNKVVSAALDAKANTSALKTVATTGSYDDLTDKPTIPDAVTVDAALSATSTNAIQNKAVKAALDGKMNTATLATVATSGAYSDLTGAPTIAELTESVLEQIETAESLGV